MWLLSTSFFKFPSSSILIKKFYLNTDESQDKNIRLHTQVWYSENSCLSLKHIASVFQLNRYYKNLKSNECVENFCQDLGDTRNNTVLTSDDLPLFLDSLITNHENQVPAQPEDQTSDETNMPRDEQQTNDTVEHSLDEHITALLVDEKGNELS